MKLKNTYSRKAKGKNGKIIKQNVTNINIYNVNFVNITNINNINYSQETQPKPESNKSESSNPFDQLLKGPTYHVFNQSQSSLLGYGEKFFSKRQETVPFYKSDAELSCSTSVSTLLFKDSKDSNLYSPSELPSPVEYRQVKNKLVKVKNKPQIIVSKKNPHRVQKKRQMFRRKKHLTEKDSETCASSTPTRPNALLGRGKWLDTYVSPILPPPCTLERSLFAYGESQNIAKQSSALGITALIEGLGNLGLKTPHKNKCLEEESCARKEPELFDYESPNQVLINCKNAHDYKHLCLSDKDGSLNSGNDMPHKELGDRKNSGRMILENECFNSPQVLRKISCSESDKNISSNSGVSTPTPQQERFEEEENQRESVLEKLVSKGLHCSPKSEGSGNSATSSTDDNSYIGLKHLLVDEGLLSCKNSFSVLAKENSDELKKEIHSQNCSLNLFEETFSSHSSFNVKPQSVNIMSEKNEEFHNKSNLSCSLSVTEYNRNENSVEEMNDSKNSIQIEGQYGKTEVLKKDPEASYLKELNYEKSFFEEKRMCESPFLNDMTNSPLRGSNYKKSPEILRILIPLSKENKKPEQNSIKDKSNLQPLLESGINDTSFSVSLEAGKKWRRSLLHHKRSELKFNSRSWSIAADTLVKLIRESTNLTVLNSTKLSYKNTTNVIDSLMEDQDPANSSLPISPGFNISTRNLSKVYTKRRRRNYICDMNEIPEESSSHSIEMSHNKSGICGEESVLEKVQENVLEFENIDNINVDQTNIYETPPILKVNTEALITNRKRNHRYRLRSMDLECSIYSDVVNELNQTTEEEKDSFTSCCSKLEDDDDDDENPIDQGIEVGEFGFLLQVGQPEGPKSFFEAFPDLVLENAQKIGEGVFGEVFMLERPGAGKSVIKIIPVEGSQLINNEPQKRFEEVLSELIITEELSMLRHGTVSCTSSFCELKGKFFLQGEYPAQLLKLWHDFDAKKRSDNECPDIFRGDQLYLTLELAHAGEPVETFSFKSPQQALAVFLQTTFALAVAESVLEFEHRDLHIGNVLVQKISEKYTAFTLNGTDIECPTYGVLATIIDYTLSRISFKGEVLYLDLENDPELFTAQGDYQFDIYRHMRSDLNHNWHDHQPKTNVRWLHYLMDKLTGEKFKYKQKKTTKSFRENMKKMALLKEIISDFYSATDLATHLIHSFCPTVSLFKLSHPKVR